jgi:hypothetical protein
MKFSRSLVFNIILDKVTVVYVRQHILCQQYGVIARYVKKAVQIYVPYNIYCCRLSKKLCMLYALLECSV